MANGNSDFVFYHYSPTLVGAAIFIAIFFLLTLLHAYQMIRTRTWFFIPFCIGGLFEAIGYIGRAIGHGETPNWTVGAYVIQAVLILVAPALFAASIYMELGRIMRVTGGEGFSVVKPKWLTKFFVTGDVFSFLLQSAGGGIMSGKSKNSFNTGKSLIVGGLVVQILFFGFFIIVAFTFYRRMRKNPTSKVLGDGQVGGAWKIHLLALFMASWFILVRSIFRLVEYTQGNNGYLISHEVFLYVFDAVLMTAVMVIFAVVHPSQINILLNGGNGLAVNRVVEVHAMKKLPSSDSGEGVC